MTNLCKMYNYDLDSKMLHKGKDKFWDLIGEIALHGCGVMNHLFQDRPW